MLAVLVARLVHHETNHIFAPIAAVVALSGPRGERGRHAIRLVVGVFIGIGIAEIAIVLLPAHVLTLGLAAFTAMLVARHLSDERVLIVQAGASAILTMALANGAAGIDRLVDACIGAGIALAFSQLFFPPEPVRLLRRAESAALTDLSRGLRKVASALASDDMSAAADGLTSLRELRDRLAELARLRRAGPRVARHSVLWRSQSTSAVEESENANELDLLSGCCIVLTRATLAASSPSRAWLAPCIAGFAEALDVVADHPGDRERRQRAAGQVIAAARLLARPDAPDDPALSGAVFVARMAAHDILLFAGAPEHKIAEAISADGTIAEPDLRPIPESPHLPFQLDKWRTLRRFQRSAGKQDS